MIGEHLPERPRKKRARRGARVSFSRPAVSKRLQGRASLVTDGVTGRPTEHDGPKDQPPGWWQDFWRRFSGKIHPGS